MSPSEKGSKDIAKATSSEGTTRLDAADQGDDVSDTKPTGKPARTADEARDASIGLTRVKSTHIDAILDRMRRGEWERGTSHHLYAAEYGLNMSTARNYASEAWRAFTREVTDPALVTQQIADVLSTSLRKANSKSDFSGVARIADVWSRVTGARAPERHEVSMVVAEYERLDRQGKLSWLNERIQALEEARAELMAPPVVDVPQEGEG